MVQRTKMVPCQSREALVTISSYQNGIIDGELRHPRLNGSAKLWSLAQMVLLLNSLLDLESVPGSPLPLVAGDRDAGEKEIFRIQVLFRENYSWQGRLIWQNENREAVFRSVLELLQLFDEILGE